MNRADSKEKVMRVGAVVSIVSALLFSLVLDFPYLAGASVIIGFSLCAVLSQKAKKRIQGLTSLSRDIADGELPEVSPIIKDEPGTTYLKSIYYKTEEIIDFVRTLGSGEPFEFKHIEREGKIGQVLQGVAAKQKAYQEEEQRRNWKNEGLARFGEILRMDDQGLEDMSHKILSNLVKYVDANQGSFFIEYEDEDGSRYMELTACYAYDRKKFTNRRVEEKQGLLGQVMLEKDIIYITDVPQDYVTITSGLGEATPSNLVIVPLIVNEIFYGAIELAFFNPLPEYRLTFLKEVAENIAATVGTVKVNEHTQKLLTQSEAMGQELRANEEEMRQNMEELKATQEEMGRKQSELDGLFKALNNSQAMAEFDTHELLTANEMLLNVLGYTRDELKRKFQLLIPEDKENFWTQMKGGANITSELTFKSTTGDKIWLNAHYSVITDTKGEFSKVLMLAQDITKERQLQLDNLIQTEIKSHLETIDKTIASLEFDMDGKISYVNQVYLDISGYTSEELVGNNYEFLLPEEDIDKPQTQMIWMSLKAGNYFNGQFKQKSKMGKPLWLNGTMNPILDVDGKPVKVMMFAIFNTQEKEKLHDLSQTVSALRNSTPLLEFTADGLFKSGNDLFFDSFGYTRAEIRKKPFEFFIDKSAGGGQLQSIKKKLKNEQFFEETIQFVTKSGDKKIFRATFSAIHDAEKKVNKIIVILIEEAMILSLSNN